MAKNISLTPNDEIKELLAETKFRIKLHDYVREKSESLIANTSEEFFPVDAPWSNDEFAVRLKQYEEASSDLILIMSLIGYWGTSDHLLSVSIPVKQFAIQLGMDTRSNKWTAIRLYPLTLLLYAIGIGATAANNFPILYKFFESSFRKPSYPTRLDTLAFALEESFGSVRNLFKLLPEHERYRSPASEYLFSFFKNKLEDVIFLGDDYEDVFDRFEIIYSLQHAHEREKISAGHIWGPIGRFGWKYSRGSDSNPFALLCEDAAQKKESWAPLCAGFFDGSYERFEKIVEQYAKVLQNFH